MAGVGFCRKIKFFLEITDKYLFRVCYARKLQTASINNDALTKSTSFKKSIVHKNREYTTETGQTTGNVADEFYTNEVMYAWQIYNYGNEDMLLSSTAQIPAIHGPNELLIKVHATSVNPIDINMKVGYGSTVINNVRALSSCTFSRSEFPLTLGRDFSGTVISTGQTVKNFKPGDEVWGALSVHRQGTHAQYTVANKCEISHKPRNLTHIEAASVPYAALTAWTAICTFGRQQHFQRKRYLVTGGSGGVGTFDIQLLKAWGAHVTTTCSTEATELCGNLGADVIVDYTASDTVDSLRQCERFDFILDTIGSLPPHISSTLLRPNNCSKYVSLTSPLLHNTDSHGMLLGLAKSSVQLGFDFIQTLTTGSLYGWAYFLPNGKALESIARLYSNNQIKPVIDEVFPFHKLPSAYEKVGQGHARGKTVVEMRN